jgi:2-phosphoglycerate kinase
MNNQRTEKILSWYQNEIQRDNIELEVEKKKFLNKIKNTNRENIIETLKPKKYTLWQRIKKVLMGI